MRLTDQCSVRMFFLSENLGGITMRVLLPVIAGLFVISEPAQAWLYQNGEDQMTDTKTGVVGDSNDGIGVAFKCWEGSEISLRIVLPARWDPAATYKPFASIDIRVDKETPQTLIFVPIESGGRFSLAYAENNPKGLKDSEFGTLLARLRDAKSRVVFAVAGSNFVFNADSLGKSITTFAKRCNLELPAKP